VALGLVVAACGGDDDATPAESTDQSSDDTSDESSDMSDESSDMSDESSDMSDESSDMSEDAAAVDLSACPTTIAIQTDWFPEAEHGALYQLLGDDYEFDTDKKATSGSLFVDGVDTGLDVEIRAGGPAIASPSVAGEMYVDDSLTFGYATTDGQILRYEEAPLLSVISPLEQNPQIIYWDPETYPDTETIADIGELGVTINVFGVDTYADVFVAQGIWTADQIDPSYDGTPGRFVAEGDIAQQGFASAEPWLYLNEFEEYGRDLAFQTIHDAGFQTYSQTLGIRPDDLETLRPCLESFVPLMQQTIVDYYTDPARANAIIVEAVEAYDTFWTYPAELGDWSVGQQVELGLAGNGPDSTVGNMDLERVQGVLDAMRAADMDFPADLTVDELVTNEFIDESIGF
jgi:hypothetical protein